MIKKNRLIVFGGLLIHSFFSNGSDYIPRSPDTLPTKLVPKFDHNDRSDSDLVSNFETRTMSFIPMDQIDQSNFSAQIAELKSLPIEIKFYKKSDEDDNLLSQAVELDQESKDKHTTVVQSSYHDALKAGSLVKIDTGFKKVVLHVDIDDQDKIDRMTAEFIHEFRPNDSFAKEFE